MTAAPFSTRLPTPDIVADLGEQVLAPEYPCLGAKSVFRRDRAVVRDFRTMDPDGTVRSLLAELADFDAEYGGSEEFVSFVAVFSQDEAATEQDFEQKVWSLLQALSKHDDSAWDPAVSSDPDDPHFAFSVGGRAIFIVGMHPQASRTARRTQWPVLVFNLHEQFEALRESGKYERMRDTIRSRDLALQGSLNPNLSDHGQESEARQYSGRPVEPEWSPPFVPDQTSIQPTAQRPTGRCPVSAA